MTTFYTYYVQTPINATKLEAALNDVIGEYTRFELPSFWGKSNVAIADGTQVELRKNNLLGEQHIRYGGYGGIAYHHISGEYIRCQTWRANAKAGSPR